MELQPLKAQLRDGAGKGVARKERATGRIPAVIYGEGADPIKVTLNLREFEKVIHTKAGEHAVVQIDVEGASSHNGPAMLKSVQHHPTRNTVTHADLMRINLDNKIHTSVPVVLVGRSRGVADGGVPDQQLHEIEIEALALDLPEQIEVDITNVGMNESLHVSDIPTPKGVTILSEGDRVIVAIHPPRVATGTEAAPAEGDAAAAAGEEKK